jgi:hypothetical protein
MCFCHSDLLLLASAPNTSQCGTPDMQGSFTTSKLFLPVLTATLSKRDEVPNVLVHGLRALTSILTTGILSAHAVLLPPQTSPQALHLLLHMSTSVRQAAVALFCSVAALLDVADLYALLRPALVHAVGDAGKTLSPLLFRDAAVVRIALSLLCLPSIR